MSVKQYQLIFNCTLAQFNTAITSLGTAGFNVVQAPQKFQGLVAGNTGGSAGLGQVDFSYDGKYFLRFYGANPLPIAQQANAGIQDNMMSAAMIAYLTSTLAALGAPVPSNLANAPSNQNDA